MARRFTTITETIQVRDLLTLYLQRSELTTPEGVHVWRYEEDWSDDKIAKAVAPDLNRTHVHSIRTELFGPIRGAVPPPKPKPDRTVSTLGTLETRLANVERLVRYLCQQLDVPCDPNTGT